MNYTQIKRRFANPLDKAFYSTRYAIYNEYGAIAFVYADNEQDALDTAVNCNCLDSEMMSAEDHAEYESKGWDDSFCLLGNASEPFWCEYLSITVV
jgi:hypothetical protein